MNADANKKIEELSQEDAYSIASFSESKYWPALKRMLDALELGALSQLKDSKKSNDELRKWQGVCEGLANVTLWVESITGQVKDGAKQDNP